MIKIVDNYSLKDIVVLLLSEWPTNPYTYVVIDGIKYKAIIVYDTGVPAIAIKAEGNFKDKMADFVLE